MKCAICEKEFTNETVRIVDGKAVHEECLQAKLEEDAKMGVIENIIDVPEEEITKVDEEVTAVAQPKCEVVVGMEANGNLYFLARGEDPSLLNIEGLLTFAGKKMDQIWESRMTQAPAPTEAPAE